MDIAKVHTLLQDSKGGLYSAALIQTVNCSLIYASVRQRAVGITVYKLREKIVIHEDRMDSHKGIPVMRNISQADIQIHQLEVNLVFSLLANHRGSSWPAAEKDTE